MRCPLFLSCFVGAALFSGCAYDGTIVEKRFRPLPFVESLGVDSIYNFQLRDNAGQVHSQMVTPDVFANYRVGEYFNDLQSPPAHGGKEIQGFRPAPPQMNDTPYQPVRVMQLRQRLETGRPGNIASRAEHSSKSRTATTAHHASKGTSKIARSKHHTSKHRKLARKHHAHHHGLVASAK